MDKFKPGEDLFCTDDGHAQDRIPADLSQIAVQNGTVLNARMVNNLVFEQANFIEELGGVLDPNTENQMVSLFKKIVIYNNVGQINSWIIPKNQIPKSEAVLDGSLLYASNYEDNLSELKKRCPSWISGENIQLPDYREYFQRFSSSRTLGGTQGDAMQKVSVGVSGNITVVKPKKSSQITEITIPGRIYSLVYKEKRTGDVTTIVNIPSSKGALLETKDLLQASSTTITLPKENFEVDLDTDVDQNGTVASENRPKNYAVLQSVVVGVPKKWT